MNKKLLWIVAFAFSFVASQSVFAHSWYCGERMNQMIDSLNLTSAQKDKIKPVMTQLKSNIQNSVSQMKDLSSQINQQVMSSTSDQTALDALVDKKTKLIGDMMKAKIDAKHQIYLILDDKQKSSYQSMVKNVEEKMAAKYKKCKNDD